MFKLRFLKTDIQCWANRYSYSENDGELRGALRIAVLKRGCLEKDEFLKICEWKTKRSKSRCARNDALTIRDISRAALATSNEATKMTLLRTLHGVEWSTASTLLHFCDKRPYPILDYRALWSLGYTEKPHYTMKFWLKYLAYVRELAEHLKQDIRTIDRALWQYSKERQP